MAKQEPQITNQPKPPFPPQRQDGPGLESKISPRPAGESLIWALAKESGKFEGQLRYPGEDGDYEKPEMDRLGL